MTEQTQIKDDLLRGAAEIAGETGFSERQIYHLHASRQLPTFLLGSIIHARRSTLRKYFEQLEQDSGSPRMS